MFRNLQCFIGLSLLFALGCGDSVDSKIRDMNGTAIQRLANSYAFFQSKNGYRGPKSEADLRDFFTQDENMKGFERAGIDVSDVDALFISPRDEQPFKIKYGVKGSPFGFKEAIIFETTGVDGQIMVGFGGAKTELMSPEEAEKLFSSRVKTKVTRGDTADDIKKLQETETTTE